jgi:hypothetical protein
MRFVWERLVQSTFRSRTMACLGWIVCRRMRAAWLRKHSWLLGTSGETGLDYAWNGCA